MLRRKGPTDHLHKYAVTNILKDEKIIKYGFSIVIASDNIKKRHPKNRFQQHGNIYAHFKNNQCEKEGAFNHFFYVCKNGETAIFKNGVVL